MRSGIVAVLMTVLIAAAYSLPAAVADDAPGPRGKDRSERMKAAWGNMGAEKQQHALEKAEKGKMFSKCTYQGNGTVQSRFVQFGYNKVTGVVSNLTVRIDQNETVRFLDSVTPMPFTKADDPFVAGATLHAFGANLTIRGHCNPTAVFGWHNENGTRNLTFKVNPGATVNVTGREARIIMGSVHSHILVNGNATLSASGTTVTAMLHTGEKAMFRAHSKMGQSKVLHEQNAAFLLGKLGAVVNLVDGEGTPAADSEDIDVETEAKALKRGHVELVARGEGIKGNRVVFIMVDGETFDLSKKDKIKIMVGGAAAAALADAASASSASGAAAFVTDADGAIHIVVNVPHFSDQTITVSQEGTDGPTSKGAPGLGLIAGLLGVAAVLAAFGRRKA